MKTGTPPSPRGVFSAIIRVTTIDGMSANTHLEHPEDMVFHGEHMSLVDYFYDLPKGQRVSVKWDGAPALVWGKCPSSGRFFVGTKSVFNKRLIKINYNHYDIDKNHEGEVANILHVAFECLPVPSSGYLQGDFLGFGDTNIFRPNTIEYRFPDKIKQSVVVALHTRYEGGFQEPNVYYGINENDISWALRRVDRCYIVDTTTASVEYRDSIGRLMDTAKVRWFASRAKFPVARTTIQYLKTHVNKYIRQGILPTASEMYDSLPDKYKCQVNTDLFRLFYVIYNLKNKVLEQVVVYDQAECYIDGQPTDHEGFVIASSENTYKIVNRLEFSKANFTLDKNWTNEKV